MPTARDPEGRPAPAPDGGPGGGTETGPEAGEPELIWLRPERAARGPVPSHSRASIAAAAIALADAEGIAAVSMRKIAAALGAGTMSLYNYVPKKEHLFDLMLDAVAGEYRLPDGPSGEPRADLYLLARRELESMRRHPWVPALVLVRPSIGPNSLRCTEYFLGALADTGFDGGTKMELFAMLNGSVCQFAEWERTSARAVDGTAAGARWQADLVTYLTAAVSTGRYPHIAAAFSGPVAPPPAPDELFDRFLDRLLSVILGPTGG